MVFVCCQRSSCCYPRNICSWFRSASTPVGNHGRLDHITQVIAPGVALVGDHRSDVHIIHLHAERRHGRAGHAVHDGIDMPVNRPRGDWAADQGFEGARDTHPVDLVAGHAKRAVYLFAALHQFVHGPLAIGALAGVYCRHQHIAYPVVILVFADRFQHDGHEGMVASAQFRTLAAVSAFLFDNGPGFVDEPGNGITLPAQGRGTQDDGHI